MVSRYGPAVKQEGLCILPPPPTYRMLQPQRTDPFHNTTPPTYVPQQPQTQPGSQGPLRTIAPAGPPNQPTTPPNTELKVQQMPQQGGTLNIAFVQSQAPGRAQSYYRNPPPGNQSQRMTNHRQGQPAQMYPAQQPPSYVPLAAVPQMYVQAANLPYFNSGAPGRQSGFVQPAPPFQTVMPTQTIQYTYPPSQSHQHQPYYFPQIGLPRAGPTPQVPQQNPTQLPPPTLPLMQNTQQHPPQRQQRRRQHAIKIIDPATGQDCLADMYDDNSHPPSGESSARQTPQPLPPPNKEVQATFAKQVAQAISSDDSAAAGVAATATLAETIEHHQQHGHPLAQPQTMVDHHSMEPPHPSVLTCGFMPHNSPSQAVNSNYETIVQCSKLQAQTKEFIPATLTVDKETPVVSALTDSAEITIANKQPKDRESPAKSRKQREQTPKEPAPQSQHQQFKDVPKEQPSPVAVITVEKQAKENIVAASQPQQPVVSKESKETANLNQKEEGNNNRRNQRKEKSGGEQKVVSPTVTINHDLQEGNGSPVNAAPAVVNQEAPVSVSVGSGKSKQNSSQRNKDGGKQQPSQQQSQPKQQQQQPPPQQQQQQPQQPQPPTVLVPQSQPPKPNNKSSKQKEINTKGASKEGTDMDVFNDNATPQTNTTAPIVVAAAVVAATTPDVVNANVVAPSVVVANDNFNANQVIVNANNTNANNAPVITNNKRPTTETNDVIAKTDAKPLPPVVSKVKVDVTSIVRDTPKTGKTFVAPEQTDETDNASVLSAEKLVQVKNEVNAKSSKENVDTSNIMKEQRPNLPYKKDQWSPSNPDGKKIYDVDFLLALRTDPKSNRKPDIHSDIYRAICMKSNSGGRTDFAPAFGNSFMGKSSSQHQPPPKRNSQSKMGGGGGNKGNKSTIRVSISVREDVKLHEVENAWKPTRLVAPPNVTDEEKKTEELYKKVRGVLNKLTPQKFETLINQVKDLTIDTKDRLQGVIDLVFEKAIDEPNFSNGYALMCKQLAQMQVPTPQEQRKKDGEFVNFRKLLITRCQLEFEKNSVDETKRNDMVQIIDECTDSEKKKELLVSLEDHDRRIRMKSVGNIRFIGELFKQGMLTVNIMMRCLNDLIEKRDEERLECLCKLLTTVGKELEGKRENLNPIFTKMKEIVDKKHEKVSSRIRFMLQDVMDLRKSGWVPRRQDFNPKTIDQIQKEAETEQLNIQAMNAIAPRKDDRGGGGGGGGGGGSGPGADRKNRRNVSDDGWSTATHTRNRPGFSVQSDKLKNRAPQMDEPLGSSTYFSAWSRGAGSAIKGQQPTVPAVSANIYAHLDTDSDKQRSLGAAGNRPSGKDQYSSKGPSMERTYKQYSDEGRNSRSGSQHRSTDSLTGPPSLRGSPAPTAAVIPTPSQASAKPAPAIAQQPTVVLDEEQLERRLKNILEEYLNECCTVEDCDQDIKDSLPASALPKLVSYGYIDILERSKTARLQTGLLFATLIKRGTLSIQDYCTGLEEVLAQVDDLIIDIPKIWDYLGEILLHPVCQEALALKTLHACCKDLISQNHAGNLLRILFSLIIEEKGPNFLQSIWQSSGLSFNDFITPAQDATKFVKDNKFDFLLGGGGPVQCQRELSYEQIHEKLLQLVNAKASFDDVVNWINANVGERLKEKQFIRTLATAIFENSIVKNKLSADVLKGHYNLIHRFVDNKPEYELQCLFALQALINKLEHPQGILLAICSKLYEDGIFPQDSFIQWEQCNDPAEREGKGVALKQLTSFFTQLKENDEEDFGSSASDEA